jgi:hypothetical protein
MLVAIRSAYGFALDHPFDAWAVNPASKRERSAGLGVEQDVLLVDCSLKFPFLPWALVKTCDDAALLRDLHRLRSTPAIGAFRVNRPIAGDIGWLLLCDDDTASGKQCERDADQNQLRDADPHGFLQPVDTFFKTWRDYRRTTRTASRTGSYEYREC